MGGSTKVSVYVEPGRGRRGLDGSTVKISARAKAQYNPQVMPPPPQGCVLSAQKSLDLAKQIIVKI